MPKTVLIAESNDVFSNILAGTLSILGFTVESQTSRESEIAPMILKTRPDLLLIDFNLFSDSMAAIPALQRLKGQHPEMKILVLGFYDATDEFEKLILDAGLDGFWNKSDKREGLINKLNFLFP